MFLNALLAYSTAFINVSKASYAFSAFTQSKFLAVLLAYSTAFITFSKTSYVVVFVFAITHRNLNLKYRLIQTNKGDQSQDRKITETTAMILAIWMVGERLLLISNRK